MLAGVDYYICAMINYLLGLQENLENRFLGISRKPKKQLNFFTNRPFELMYQGRKTRNLELIW